MRRIPFVKMQGTGNDFIMVDNRKGVLKEKELAEFARAVCARRISVGADGVELLEKSRKAQYRMRLFNADGSEAEMCGNGSRCMARFARDLGVAGRRQEFETLAGIVRAEVTAGGAIVTLPLPEDGEGKGGGTIREFSGVRVGDRTFDIYFINTGVPHAVVFVDDLKACDVRGWGRQIRYHELFKPKGTNANFVSVTGRNSIAVRTYERGVEDETLACGTGSTAAAIVAAATKRCAPPVEALTASGEKLRIYFRLDDGGRPADVRLEGSVTTVCRGELYWRGR